MAGLPLTSPASVPALIDWLHEQTLAGAGIPALLSGMCERLVRDGVPLVRCVIGVDTLHPTLDGYFFLWRRESAEVQVVAYSRETAAKEADKWLRSPFHHLDTIGRPSGRWNVARGEGVNEFPILADLRADGVTDYLCFRHRLSDGAIGDLDAIYSSWTTAAEGGFDDGALALLEATVPTLSVAVTTASYAQIARNLAETYLGRDIGARVLAGEIVRGRAERLEAVIWFSDLAGFTRISDAAPPEAIIPLLNDYAEAVADAVHAMKGEVLKFIGDGVLALFRSGSAEESCRRALAAVIDLRGRIAELNERRGRESQPVTGLRLGLHLGDVYFGNIGSADRLDFTAVGPAVNEASRVVAMCRSLDQEILVSSRFAAEAGDARARLVSVGRYALRGVGRPQELFTLDPEIA